MTTYGDIELDQLYYIIQNSMVQIVKHGVVLCVKQSSRGYAC